MGGKESEALVRRFIEDVMNGGDPSAVDELIGPDVVVYNAVVPDGSVGLEAFKRAMARNAAVFTEFALRIDAIVADDDRAAVLWTAHATHGGAPFLGVPATGRRVRYPGAYFFRIADGRIVEQRTVWDLAGVRAQLGAPGASAGVGGG